MKPQPFMRTLVALVSALSLWGAADLARAYTPISGEPLQPGTAYEGTFRFKHWLDVDSLLLDTLKLEFSVGASGRYVQVMGAILDDGEGLVLAQPIEGSCFVNSVGLDCNLRMATASFSILLGFKGAGLQGDLLMRDAANWDVAGRPSPLPTTWITSESLKRIK